MLQGFKEHLKGMRTREGYPLPETTITSEIRRIKSLSRAVNLRDANAVERCLEDAALLGGTKMNYAVAYQNWCES